MLDNRKVIIDEECKLAECGSAAIVASAAATIDGVAKKFDTGGGYTEGLFVMDLASIVRNTAAASCQTIEVCLEGSTTSTFTTYAKLCGFKFGTKAAAFAHSRLGPDSTLATTIADGASLRYTKPFHNVWGGAVLRWLRVYTVFAGTVSNNSIDFSAYLSKR
jgi:hypothetical protein